MKIPVAIVGGGPGGASAALFLAKHGVESVIIERDEFPRYHIGESMTGECGAVVRDLGLEEKMLAANHPKKQGVVVFGPNGKNPWFVPVMARDEENKLFPQFTWNVRRSDFDHMMAEEVAAKGVKTIRGTATSVIKDGDAIKGVNVKLNDGTTMAIESELLMDCSGQQTFLARQGVTSRRVPGFYDKQVAIFSQVENPIRGIDEDAARKGHPDNTLIFYKAHHHWAWFIPLDQKTVSVGVVSPGAYFQSKNESKGDFIERELKELNPELARRIQSTTLVEEPRAIPNYSYHVKTFTGKGWICIGDAHRFIDPIFSFGLYLSMKEAQHVAPFVAEYLKGKNRDAENPFQEHMDWAEAGMNILQDLIDAFWEKPFGFAMLIHGERHKGDMIDMFAGRVHFNGTSAGLEEMRLLKHHGMQKNAAMKQHYQDMEKGV